MHLVSCGSYCLVLLPHIAEELVCGCGTTCFLRRLWGCTGSKNQLRECRLAFSRPLDRNAILQLIFLISKEIISCGFSKEPSKEANSFEHQKTNVWTDRQENIHISLLIKKPCLSRPMVCNVAASKLELNQHYKKHCKTDKAYMSQHIRLWYLLHYLSNESSVKPVHLYQNDMI